MQRKLYLERIAPSILRRDRNRRRLVYSTAQAPQKDLIPLIPCRGDEIHLTFWCPYCQVFHRHGSCGGDFAAAVGHQSAHCFEPGSPFKKTGYFLVLDREWQKIDAEWLAGERERSDAREQSSRVVESERAR